MTRAAYALRYWERRQEVAANNLANVNTDGFKAERVFARLMGDAQTVIDTSTDLRPGTFKPTGAPLDLALEGDAFFVVETPDGERFSRGGSFRLDEGGRIVDANGNALLGEGGPLIVPPGTPEIDGSGTLRVGEETIGRLRVETPAEGAGLAHEDGTRFVSDAPGEPIAPEARRVRQGMLEESNVSTIGSLVDMISVQRAYSAVQKTVVTLDSIRQTIANEIGKPA